MKAKTYPVAIEKVDGSWQVWVSVAGNPIILAKDSNQRYAISAAKTVAWELNINVDWEAK